MSWRKFLISLRRQLPGRVDLRNPLSFIEFRIRKQKKVKQMVINTNNKKVSLMIHSLPRDILSLRIRQLRLRGDCLRTICLLDSHT